MSDLSTADFHWCFDEAALPQLNTSQEAAGEREFHEVRNAVLRALRPLGTVGPMGEFPLHLPPDDQGRAWKVETSDPCYFVVDDQMGGSRVHIHVEVQSSREITVSALEALWTVVRAWPTSGIGIAVPKARYFYLAEGGVWFLDAQRSPAASLIEAVGLPEIEAAAA
jgi:hypothetical protein